MNKDLFPDPAALLRDNINTYAQGVSAGIEAERRHWLTVLDAIFITYRKALGDPKVCIPTALHAAIAVAQRDVGDIRAAEERSREEARENAQAEAAIREDQRRRYEGHEDAPGMDLVGRCMRAGM